MCKNLCPTLRNEIWKCNLELRDVKILFGVSFWSDVLTAWCSYNYVANVSSDSEVYSQVIWYNSNIRIQDKPFIFEKPAKEGLMYIAQLYDLQGRRVPQDVCEAMFSINMLQYNQIISAIPKKWKKCIENETVFIPCDKYTELLPQKHQVAKIYKVINCNTISMENIKMKWNRNTDMHLNDEDLTKLFCNIWRITNNAKLRSFQFRILHSAVTLNSHLYRWRIKASPNCDYCDQKETIIHFLWECHNAKKIWSWFKKFCQELCDTEDCSISRDSILTNVINENPTHVFNFCALVIKQTMYALRCLRKNVTVFVIKSRIERYRRFELYEARKRNKEYIHNRKWHKINEM